MSSPYQNQTVVVHNNVNVNNNMNEDRSTVKTHKKKKKKNIRYTGTTMLFLTIVAVVAVTVMISARKVPPTLFGSLTNTNVRTSTTAIMSSDEDDETWYDATEEKDEAGQHDDNDSDTDSNTSDRFDPHEYPPVQFTPKKEAHGYGNTVTVTKKNTKQKCPACYFPTSTIVENGNVCQQLCHDTKKEQTHTVRKGRGWNFLGTSKVQDNWCAGTYLSTKEVQVGKDKFTMACIFKTGDNGGSIFDKSY